MREAIGPTGVHYRLHPANPRIVQEQPGPRLRWRTHSRWATEALARAYLARLGRLQDNPPTPQQECHQ